MDECPCGSDFPYTDCCAPLIRKTWRPDTAEDMMRSRYSAYVKKEWEYLVNTTYLPEKTPETRSGYEAAGEGISWKNLEIIDTQDGGADASEGTVTFIATYLKNEQEKQLYEKAKFIKKDGGWYYSPKKSQVKNPIKGSSDPVKPYVRQKPKTGRNALCPRRSGKKYKKCCGK